jgi:hypothetical protein
LKTDKERAAAAKKIIAIVEEAMGPAFTKFFLHLGIYQGSYRVNQIRGVQCD